MKLFANVPSLGTAVAITVWMAAPPANAAVIRVPQQAATVQDAVDAASR